MRLFGAVSQCGGATTRDSFVGGLERGEEPGNPRLRDDVLDFVHEPGPIPFPQQPRHEAAREKKSKPRAEAVRVE